MIRFALILALASCAMLTAQEPAPQEREPAAPEHEAEAPPEPEPKRKPERAKPDATPKPPPQPLPPQCDMETEDTRQEFLNKLDCLLKTK